MAAAIPANRAVLRLARDMRAMQQEPVEGVAAALDERNALLMYANLVPSEGPYAGIAVHIHLQFETDYPARPPRVEMITPLRHPNVYGTHICLDMLTLVGERAAPYQGWSAAYDAAGILRQLHAFLLCDDTIEQQHGGSVARGARHQPTDDDLFLARRCKCSCRFSQLPPGCRHGEAPAAATHVPPPLAVGMGQRKLKDMGVGVPDFPTPAEAATLPGDVVTYVLQLAGSNVHAKVLDTPHPSATAASAGGSHPAAGLAPTPAAHAQDQAASSPVAETELERLALELRLAEEQRCFFFKEPLDRHTVLGFGVAVERRRGDGSVRGLSMVTDLLSHRAFSEAGVRKSAWNIPFDAFLPLALNPEHCQRALALLPGCLYAMTSAVQGRPGQLLDVLAQLLNGLVVMMMKDASDGRPMTKGMSDNALQGFAHLHHLLLSAVTLWPVDGPAILAAAERDVRRFMSSPAARHKAACPDLGMLLVKLLLVPADAVPWAAFAPLYVRELLARQVLWLQRELGSSFTSLAAAASARQTDESRLRRTFAASLTGLRLVALESWFANALARPKTGERAMEQLTAIRQTYDARGGSPPAAVFARFNGHARSVARLTTWTEWLGAMRLGLRNDACGGLALMARVLRQAILDSHAAGYHKGAVPPGVTLEAWGPHPPLAVISSEW